MKLSNRYKILKGLNGMKIEIRKGSLSWYVVAFEKEWYTRAKNLKECLDIASLIIEKYDFLYSSPYIHDSNSLNDITKYTEIIILIDSKDIDFRKLQNDFVEYLI